MYLSEIQNACDAAQMYEARLRKAISDELAKTAYLQPVAAIPQCRAIELPISSPEMMLCAVKDALLDEILSVAAMRTVLNEMIQSEQVSYLGSYVPLSQTMLQTIL